MGQRAPGGADFVVIFVAIDPAHRIGQSRQVFAYRLIPRDTVEEKDLELLLS